MNRPEQIAALRQNPHVSVLIVGGGINGVGLLRELALQGIDTLLVEKSDFSSGASAASTRIIHGGLRYLENREFRLVKEALRERNRLLQNAPHCVQPLATTIPIFYWAAGLFPALAKFAGLPVGPYRKGALLFKAGLSLYDRFAGRQDPLPRHVFNSRQSALSLRPQLPRRLVCTATYFDASISYPERLALELVLDAEQQCPQARALNYVRAVGSNGDSVLLADEFSGQQLSVTPQIVVNASGAWIDATNFVLGHKTAFIGGTKGSHIVIDHPELVRATQGQMLYFENTDGRICLFYPVGGKVLAGSTDIPITDPDMAVCDDEEVEYILASVRRVFPSIKVEPSHIVYRFCGVRPLARSHSSIPGEITRDHLCPVLPAGKEVRYPVYSLVGGKWTTFRAFSEQVADQILRDLQKPRQASSRDLPIGGGRGFPAGAEGKSEWVAAFSRTYGLEPERAEQLLDRYGTRAKEVAEFISLGSDAPLPLLPEYSQREILFLAEHEKVLHLDDVVLRRTAMALLGQLSASLLEELAAIIAPALQWSETRIQREVSQVVKIMRSVHGVRL